MQLYRLLPSVIRQRDRLGSSVTDESAEETVLQKIFYSLEQDCDTTSNLADGLRDLLLPDSCPVAYLPLLEYLLGSSWPSSWPESRRRLAIAAVVKLYHHSGQRLSWVSLLGLLGNVGFFPWELWKENVYETIHYSRYGGGDYYGLYHAARVDITDGHSDLLLSDEELLQLEKFRPVHVLIRRQFQELDIASDIANAMSADDISYAPTLNVSEALEDVSDALAVSISCVATCETICESLCETTVET